MRPRGVAVAEMLFTVFSMISGSGMRSRVHTRPTTMPRIMGLVTMPLQAFFRAARLTPLCCGLERESTSTAATLYRGTAPMITRLAAPALPYRFSRKAAPSRAMLLR